MEFKCKCKTATIYQPRFVFVLLKCLICWKIFCCQKQDFPNVGQGKIYVNESMHCAFIQLSSTIFQECFKYNLSMFRVLDEGLVSLLMIQNFKEIFVSLKNWWAWLSEMLFLFPMAVYIYDCQFALGHI